MAISLKKRVLIFSFLSLLVTLGASAYFDVRAIFDSYRHALALRLNIHAESLRFEIEKVQNLGLDLEEMEGVSARCQEILSRDKDLSYCIVQDTGDRILFAHDPSLLETKTFPPRSDEEMQRISGFRDWGPLYDASIPILNASRVTTGWIRIGFSEHVLNSLAQTAIIRNLVILVLVFMGIYALIVVFIQKHLFKPINHLCDVAQQIKDGDFHVESLNMSTAEFQTLSDQFMTMANSLVERDEKIAAGIEELEEANLLLQKAYEDQERISTESDRNRRLYQTLVDQASEAILVCNENDEIQLFNHQAEQFFASSKDNVLKTNFIRFFQNLGVENVDLLYEMYQGVIDSGLGAEEFSFVTPEGHERVGLVSAVLISGESGEKLVQMIVHDVTQEHLVKSNLEKSAADLTRLNSMKNTFLGMVSHELKTPLTIILGYADLLDTQRDLSVDPVLKESLEHIIEASERLGRVIQDMVDASDLDGHRVALKHAKIDLNQVLEQSTEKAVAGTLQRGHRIALDLDKELPPVLADAERLGQMMGHLLNNAVKFTPDNGDILIKSQYLAPGSDEALSCSCGGDRSAGCVEIIIADTGVGIPEDERESVFEKFYGPGPIEEHSSSRVSFMGKGVGLGLTIVKGIVELHGGEVWVDSEHSSSDNDYTGSAFHVRLPVRPAQDK